MADTDRLITFTPSSYPSIPGGETRYLVDADRRIAQSLASITECLKRLEARMVAHGI